MGKAAYPTPPSYNSSAATLFNANTLLKCTRQMVNIKKQLGRQAQTRLIGVVQSHRVVTTFQQFAVFNRFNPIIGTKTALMILY